MSPFLGDGCGHILTFSGKGLRRVVNGELEIRRAVAMDGR